MAALEELFRHYPFGRPITADDWYTLPDELDRYELYEGALLLRERPDLNHQIVVARLAIPLIESARREGGFVWLGPIGVTLDQFNAFEPDIVSVSAERMRLVSGRGIEGAPDLVVEVASPSTQHFDCTRKMPAYFEHGVREVWLVDPAARTVAVYTSATADPAIVDFGVEIPSTVVTVGNGGLDSLPSLG